MLPISKTSKVSLYFLSVVSLGIASIYVGLAETVQSATLPQITHPTHLEMRKTAIVEPDYTGIPYITKDNSDTAKVTAFSSAECHTTWCNAHPDRIGHQIALNYSKFGKAKQVYIPEYGQTYNVIGATDQNTDLDIYYGADYEGAKAHGVKYLDFKLIK